MLVIAMIAVGGVSRWLLQHDGAGSIRRTLAVEAVVGVAVVALAAGIVGQPPRVGTPSQVHTASVTANGVIAEVTVTPGQVGGNDIHVVITPPGGSLTPVSSASARVLLPAEGVVVARAFPPYDTWVRITIGLPAENDQARAALRKVLATKL